MLLFMAAYISTKSVLVSISALWAVVIQFVAYGMGFLIQTIVIDVFKKEPEQY